MSEEPKVNFVSELKERRIVQYLGAYVGLAFGIIQFAEFAVNRYGWSESLVDKILIFFVALLPAIIIFTYNHGKPGIDNWRSYEKIIIPGNILVAFILSGFLFNSASSTKQTETVEYVNEEGEQEQRIIASSNYSNRLLVFPFKHSESVEQWEALSTSFLVDRDLEQDVRLYSNNLFGLKTEYDTYNEPFPSDLKLSTKIKIATDWYTDYFVTASIDKTGEEYVFTPKVYATSTGEVFYEESFTGSDLFGLIDNFSTSLSKQLYLPEQNVKNLSEFIDLPAAEIISNDYGTIEKYMLARYQMTMDGSNTLGALELIKQATEIDENCSLCYSLLSNLQSINPNNGSAMESMNLAVQNAAVLPERLQFQLKYQNYFVQNQPEKAINLLKTWVKLYPRDITPVNNLFSYYETSAQFNKAKEVAKIAIENGHKGNLYKRLANLYINTDELDEAEKYITEFSKLYPHKSKDISELGSIYVKKGELEKAKNYYEDILLLDPNNLEVQLELSQILIRLGLFDESESAFHDAMQSAKTIQDTNSVYLNMVTLYDARGNGEKVFETLYKVRDNMRTYLPEVNVLSFLGYQQGYIFTMYNQKEELQQILDDVSKLIPEERKSVMKCINDYLYSLFTEDGPGYSASMKNCLPVILSYNGADFEQMARGHDARLNGRHEEATEYYKKFSSETGMQTDMLWFFVIDSFIKSGKFEEAKDILDKQEIENKASGVLFYYLAELYHAQGEEAKATSYLSKALDIWENASPDYKYYILAKELERKLNV